MIEVFKNDKLEMEYLKFGKGNKNMIIIPGVSISSVMNYKDAVISAYKKFENDFSIYLFDRKRNMTEGYSVFDMAVDMIEVLDGLNLKDLYILGTSQGGMISLIISIKRPDLVKKLNVNSTTFKVTKEYYSLFDKLIKYANDNKIDELLDILFKALYSKELYDSIKDSIPVIAKSLTKEDIERFIIQSKALESFDISNDIQKIKADTFIVAAKPDQIFDYNDSIILNKEIKNSELYIYENYGHVVYDEALDFKDKLYNFYMK